jgi:hypothetical protein
VVELLSWSQHGRPRRQLDLRHDAAPRGLLGLGLQRCRHCGHTARDLSIPPDDGLRKVLRHFDLADFGLEGQPGLDDLAGLLVHGLHCGDTEPHRAAWAWMHAAWMLDDRVEALARHDDASSAERADILASAAGYLRRRAAAAVARSMGTSQPFEPAPSGWAVRADLLRRAGAFEVAAAACRDALRNHGFDGDEALTVRDRLQHTLNLATDHDARAAYIDDAERRAVDYPERLARREARELVDGALRSARIEAARQDAQAREAPARLVEQLADGGVRGGDTDGLPADWPLPSAIRRLMTASGKAYGWPDAALGPVLVAALARVLGAQAAALNGYLAARARQIESLEAEVTYMAHVLRETTAERWGFRAPPEGFRRVANVAPASGGAPAPPPPAARDTVDRGRAASSVRQQVIRRFQVDLPDEYWPEALCPVGDGDILSTHPHHLPDLLMGAATAERLQALEPGHLTIGFWGHGSNSYAFYVVRRLADEHLYLRLHTGGAYTDPAQAAAEITDYLPVLFHLQREVRRLGGRLIAVQGIGSGDYVVRCAGKGRRLQASLLGRPDALTLVQRLLDHVQGKEPAFDAAPMREQAHRVAMAQYTEATRAGGNVRVPMRAVGAAMSLIRRSGDATSAAEYRHQLLLDLAALAERHEDLDGDHEGGRAALRRLVETLKQALGD